MTRDEIIRLAVECQLVTTGNRDGVYMDALERFAHAVTQAELDALREQEPAILPDEAYELGLDAIPYYAAPTPPTTPEGWQLVPVEPTEEMLNSVRLEMKWCNPVGIFSKMIAVAPKPGEEND